jgi:hypothetical protein
VTLSILGRLLVALELLLLAALFAGAVALCASHAPLWAWLIPAFLLVLFVADYSHKPIALQTQRNELELTYLFGLRERIPLAAITQCVVRGPAPGLLLVRFRHRLPIQRSVVVNQAFSSGALVIQRSRES